MTLFRHELKCGVKSLTIWSSIIAFLIFICMLMYPEMKEQMEGVEDLFAGMGEFTAAFGMDKINFGEVMGFYGIEAGNMIGLGGGFFAALLGVSALSKEESNHTAEFLLTHPISRIRVVSEKLFSIFIQLIIFHIINVIVAMLSFVLIGETIIWDSFNRFHLAQLLSHIEIACICFGISAFLKRGGLGIGLGTSALLYFMNLISNISKDAEFLRFITPFHYSEASKVFSESSLDGVSIVIGLLIAMVSVVIAYIKYTRKDITS